MEYQGQAESADMFAKMSNADRDTDRDAELDGGSQALCRETTTGPTGATAGIRIGDVAARAGVSTRTLRYYEELGLLAPSGHTAGGERRYEPQDLARLERIMELKELLGMNLEEIRSFLSSQTRLDELRVAYQAQEHDTGETARQQRRAILEEALDLQALFIERLDAKLERMVEFRSQMNDDIERCRSLLVELMEAVES